MNSTNDQSQISDELVLNYHLMHPGGDSQPGDPNPAFYLDGTYHLHYILRHPWKDGQSFSFVHVTSPDMLNWTWHKTKLQPSFTGHGMFSGTGFITKEGRPAAIYHGQASGRNQIALARDNALSAWDRPYSVEPKTTDGKDAEMRHWDPDCFLINDTYYAISGGPNPPLIKSDNLTDWTLVGEFLKHELPDVAIGEDISCPNFFPLGDRWMLLCISHPFGCRYYLGDWDTEAEQFVPESHHRMNWRRPDQSIYETRCRDFFAPESVLTPDGRRVMWAWCATLDEAINPRTIQSLPRELSLGDDGTLRIRPLRELETLRHSPIVLDEIAISPPEQPHSSTATHHIADLNGNAQEIRITMDRSEALRKRFGFQLFADDSHEGLPVMIHPESRTIRLGTTEAPFAVADLPDGENVELRIFIDKYIVEVFVNNRQSVVVAYMDYQAANGFKAYVYGGPTKIRQVEIWELNATNKGFLEARESKIWEPEKS